MSAFNVEGGLVTEDPVRLTDNAPTIVYPLASSPAKGSALIASIIVCPTSGTPNITIEWFNAAGSSVGYLRKAVAVSAAGTPFIFNEPFVLPPLYTLRVTSSSGTGDMDVFVTRGVDYAAGRGGI